MLNLLFLIVGIVIGYFLDKTRVKSTTKSTEEKLRSILIKPEGRVINSKEVNSLNKDSDEVNYQHNDFFDGQN